MEFDPSCCAFQGKLHADRRTLEYVGRGNHEADAACFRTCQSVGASSYASQAAHDGQSPAPPVPRLPVFYYETQVLATAGDDADDVRHDLDARVTQHHTQAQTRLDDTSSGFSAPTASMWTGTSLPWRVRARRLIQSRILDLETPGSTRTTPSSTSEDVIPGANGSAPRGVGADSEEMVWHFPSSGDDDTSASGASSGRVTAGFTGSDVLVRELAEQDAMDMDDIQDGTDGSGAGTRAGASASASGMHFAFTLSSRTLQQMRSRQERRRLRRSSERRRFSHRIAIGFSVASGAPQTRSNAANQYEHASATSEDDAMTQEDGGEASKGTESAQGQRDLGQTASSLAYVGKTGRVVSNGREFLQCERYGAGDVVGCGVLLDAQTFFFTLNGRLMGVLPASDVHHLDDFVAGMADSKAAGVVALSMDVDAWQSREDLEAEQGDVEILQEAQETQMELFPTVSLHDAGECVHAAFTSDEFQFDLKGFEQQVQKERQRALLLERETRRRDGEEDGDDMALDALVEDFFVHYGYESAYLALVGMRSSMERSRVSSSDVMDVDNDEERVGGQCEEKQEGERRQMSPKERASLHLRHEVRGLVRGFQTARALELLEKRDVEWRGRWRSHRKLQLDCRILCVVDVLVGKTSPEYLSSESATSAKKTNGPEGTGGGTWNAELAILYARTAFDVFTTWTLGDKRKRAENGRNGDAEDATEREEISKTVALVMSLLLYDSRESVPRTSLARRFLTSAFRESVADQLNDLLLSRESKATGANGISQLESFLLDVDALQSECLRQGCRVFPEAPESVVAGNAGKRKASTSRRRGLSVWDAIREEQLLSSGSDDSSSTLPRSDQEDREEEEEEEE